MKQQITRGNIYYADLGKTIGSEQSGVRPSLIVQNDVGNLHSPTTQIIPLTTQPKKASLPTHVRISPTCGLDSASIALAEQLRTIDKSRLDVYIGRISPEEQTTVNRAMLISLGMDTPSPEAETNALGVVA